MKLIRWVGQGCIYGADQVGGAGGVHGADHVGGAVNCRWESGCVSA